MNFKIIQQFDIVWFIWLLLVSIWNFGWPSVPPIADVLVAVILSITAYQFKNRENV
tara:strand:+ start:212 stop:379 length:168 start_codon:yes stop_codon:yes gene_type:complete